MTSSVSLTTTQAVSVVVNGGGGGDGGREQLSPWTGGDTSPAPPRVCPDTLALRIQTAPTRKGAAWISLLFLATTSLAGRRGSWGRRSRRGTRSSGTGGTASARGPQEASEGAETGTKKIKGVGVGWPSSSPPSPPLPHNSPCTTVTLDLWNAAVPTPAPRPGPCVSPVWGRGNLPP